MPCGLQRIALYEYCSSVSIAVQLFFPHKYVPRVMQRRSLNWVELNCITWHWIRVTWRIELHQWLFPAVWCPFRRTEIYLTALALHGRHAGKEASCFQTNWSTFTWIRELRSELGSTKFPSVWEASCSPQLSTLWHILFENCDMFRMQLWMKRCSKAETLGDSHWHQLKHPQHKFIHISQPSHIELVPRTLTRRIAGQELWRVQKHIFCIHAMKTCRMRIQTFFYKVS